MDDDVRFTLRLPAALHAQLSDAAGEAGISLNKFMADVLAERVGGPTSITVALRQATAAIRAAGKLAQDDRILLRRTTRERNHFENIAKIVQALAMNAGVTEDQFQNAWKEHQDELEADYEADKPKRVEMRRQQFRESIERYEHRLTKSLADNDHMSSEFNRSQIEHYKMRLENADKED